MMKDVDASGILLDIVVDEEHHNEVQRKLHQALLTFTGGSAHSLITSLGPNGAFEAHRQIYARGKKRSVANITEMRRNAMRHDVASGTEVVEKRLLEWKKNIPIPPRGTRQPPGPKANGPDSHWHVAG